jgi:hypothetical protein
MLQGDPSAGDVCRCSRGTAVGHRAGACGRQTPPQAGQVTGKPRGFPTCGRDSHRVKQSERDGWGEKKQYGVHVVGRTELGVRRPSLHAWQRPDASVP